ncbi:MAG: tape measure protein [Phocaeicola massiliensis]
MNNNEGTTWWALGLDNAKFESDVAKSNSLFRSIGNTAEKEGSRIDNIFRKITVAATGFFTAQQALGYAQKIAQVRGEYQQLEVAFNTMLGSKAKADALMTQLVNTAAKTPFDLVGVSSSAKQLLAYGIAADKVNDTLVRLGNIAAGLSIPLQDIAWLYGTTMTQGRLYAEDLNQFTGRGIPMIRELAKELGVAENEVKALVSEGKVGFPEVQKVIENLTNSGGMFYNLMEEQSNTITGKISNMEDAISVMFNEIGQANEGIINSILETGISAIENYEEIGKVIGDLVLMYGTYKAAIITISALQSLQAYGIAALTAKEVIHYGWLVATQKAQLLLNRTIMANPYVAVAVAVAGIATAMWNFHDGITEAEKAQDRFNKKQKEAKEEEEEHKRKIDQLVESSRNIALSDLQRGHSLSELRKEYPKIFKQYDIESIKLADILKLKQQIAEEDSKRAVEKQANELSEIEKEITYYENLLKSLSGQQGVDGYVKKLKELRADRDVLLQEKGKGISEQFLSTLKDVDTKQLDLYMSVLEKRISGKGENGTIKMKLPIDIQGTLSDEAVYDVKQIKALIESVKSARVKLSTPQKVESQNKKYWEKQKKEATEALEAINSTQKRLLDAGKFEGIDAETVANYKKQIKLLKEAENELEVYSSSSKKEKQEDSIRKQNEKYKLLMDKQAVEQSRMQEDLQLKVEQSRIDAMQEGSARTIAQMELNHKKEKLQLQREKEDYIQSIIENEREKFEANPANKGKSFNSAKVDIPQSELNKYNLLFSELNIKQDNETRAFTKGMVELYQSYTDTRIAIEKKFNEDIATLRKQREESIKKGDDSTAEALSRSISKAIAEKGKALMKHDFDILKQSPEYIRAFEDLRNTSTNTLTDLLRQLEQAKATAATVLNPEDLREYTSTIQSIMDELEQRNPFKMLVEKKQELIAAERELAEAERIFNLVNKGGKIVSSSRFNDKTNKIELIYLSAEEALKRYNVAKDKATKANNSFVKAENTAAKTVETLASSIQSIGGSIGGTTGEIISLMGDITSFASTCMTGMSNVSKTASASIQAIEKASVILNIISIAVSLLQKISELGNNKAFKQYEEYAEKLKEINALTDAINEYRIAALEASQAEKFWFSEDNLRQLRDFRKVHDEVYQAYIDKATEAQAIYQNQSGGGWLTGALNWVMGNLSALSWWDEWRDIWGQGDYDKGQTAAINNLRIETRKRSKGFLGTGIGGKSQKTEDLVTWARNQGLGELFDDEGLINKELAQSLIDNYGDKLVGQTKETLEALIELREKYDEYLEQLHEYVSSLYQPLVDNFVDSLWDWLDNGKDALDSFKEYASDTFRNIVSDMLRSIVLSKVVDKFDEQIATLYERYSKGEIDEQSLMKQVADATKDLIGRYETNIPTLENILNTVNGYFKDAGINLKQESDDDSRKPSTKGITAASQDSVNELNGRATAIQGHTYSINEGIKALVGNCATILEYLGGIKENTSYCKNLESINSNIGNMSSNIKEMKESIGNMNDKGVIMRK